ncbi:hypothetical protein ABXW19_12130, partial [Streptococcus suis]|uniref:hypothetical protein n=1 Tax=Streptococcus suis TaxID=1307 RepID=UPI003CEE68DC
IFEDSDQLACMSFVLLGEESYRLALFATAAGSPDAMHIILQANIISQARCAILWQGSPQQLQQ